MGRNKGDKDKHKRKTRSDKKYNIFGLDVIVTKKIPDLPGNRIVLGNSTKNAAIMFKGKA